MAMRARIRGDNNTVIHHKTVEVHYHHHYADGPPQPATCVHRVCIACNAIIGLDSDDVLCLRCRKAANERDHEVLQLALMGSIALAFILAALTVNLCRRWQWDVPWSAIMPVGTCYAIVGMTVVAWFQWRRLAEQRAHRRR